MELLKEDARRLYRFMKRTEVLVSDLKPYAPSNEALAAALDGAERELAGVKRMLEDCAAKGRLSAFMQADHMLASFAAACARLDAALGRVPLAALPAARDAAEDAAALRATLQKAVFALPPEHLALLRGFRAACDAVKGHAAALDAECREILAAALGGGGSLARTDYCASVGDLQREIRALRAYAVAAAADDHAAAAAAASAAASASRPESAAAAADSNGVADAGAAAAAADGAGADSAGAGAAVDAAAAALSGLELRAPGAETRAAAEASAYHLRVLLDVVRSAHDVEEDDVPLEYVCPLSTLIMHVSASDVMGACRRRRQGGCRVVSGAPSLQTRAQNQTTYTPPTTHTNTPSQRSTLSLGRTPSC